MTSVQYRDYPWHQLLLLNDEPVTFFHHGDQGDVIYALPCVRKMTRDKPSRLRLYYASGRVREPMDEDKVARLKPLLELQPYLLDVSFHEPFQPQPGNGVVLDRWRNHPHSGRDNLVDIVCDAFWVPRWDHRRPWLQVDHPVRVAPYIVHRSPRYHRPGFPWRIVLRGKDVAFVGSREEHRAFCRQVQDVPYHPTPNALDLARVIAGSQTFFGNQSFPLSIAHGLAHNVQVEEHRTIPNCHLNRANAIYGLVQKPTTMKRPAVHERTLLTSDRLDRIFKFARQTEDLPGEMAELGVFKGGSAKTICAAVPNKRLYLFDTFKGIPEDDERGVHKQGEFAANLFGVQQYLRGYDVEFRVGKFPHTTWGLDDVRFSFVHLDADTFQSTRAGIEFFWPRLVTGGILVLDDMDWRACPGVRWAAEELLPGVPFTVEGQHGWTVKV